MLTVHISLVSSTVTVTLTYLILVLIMSSLTLHECYRDNGLIEDPSSYSTFDHFHEKAQNVDLDVLYIILFGKILPARLGDNGGQDLITPRNDITQRNCLLCRDIARLRSEQSITSERDTTRSL